MPDAIFFQNWQSILRTLIVTVLAYFALIMVLRVSGKRTLSKMNAFDFVVTIALGSVLASASIDKSAALADVTLSFATLVFLQFLINSLSVRYKAVRNFIVSKPVLLLYKGEFLNQVLKRERITTDELYAAARAKGITNMASVVIIKLVY